MKMEPRISLITLGVGNLGQSTEFYRSLGFEKAKASNDGVTFFRSIGVVLALYPRHALAEDAKISPQGSGFSGVALAYNTRSKEEVQKILDHAKKCGGKIIKNAEDVVWGGHSGYFADPDGHLWEVAWNPFFKMDEKGILKLE